MIEMKREDVEGFVDIVARQYANIQTPSAADHYRHLSAIYGELIPDVDPAIQLQEAGKLIAVLYWRLGQANGFIPKDDDGSVSSGPGYPPIFEPGLEGDEWHH